MSTVPHPQSTALPMAIVKPSRFLPSLASEAYLDSIADVGVGEVLG